MSRPSCSWARLPGLASISVDVILYNSQTLASAKHARRRYGSILRVNCARPRLRNAADNGWTKQARKPDGKLLPGGDAALVLRIVGTHIGDVVSANIVLPNCGMGYRAPLGFEAISVATSSGTSKVEDVLSALDGTLQEVPVHEHVAVHRICGAKRAGAGDLGSALTVN